MNIYVGNLSYSVTEDQVRNLFSQYGTVHSVKIILNRDTGRPRGFCFVQMDKEEGQTAIESLNDQEFLGRKLQVNEARERGQERAPRSYPVRDVNLD